MSRAIVTVEGLSKRYSIGHKSERKDTLLGQAAHLAQQPYRALQRRLRQGAWAAPTDAASEHWALRDISFSLNEGEVLGIIGHNGAGKSTLLKILSRITHPTSGEARIRGRIASLLEVGTGFHPELTGRDNVYMNAAILGMRRTQIDRQFDEIVAFSGVEQFIDTPIRHYSSGMKVRLAFAVAAHLDPEILVIDEVLAVGDAEFQKKCLNRIEAVGASGRTILFVSHHLTTVIRLCTRTLVLDHGRIAFDGRTLDAINFYNDRLGGSRSRRDWLDLDQAPGDQTAKLRSVEVLDQQSPATGPIDVRRRIGVRLRYTVLKSGLTICPSVHLFDTSANWIFAAVDLEPEWHNRPRPAGDYETTAWIPPNLLNEASYNVTVGLATLVPYRPHCFVHDCASFRVFDPGQGGTACGSYAGEMPGIIRPILDWETRRV